MLATSSKAMDNLFSNMNDVIQLVKLHVTLTGQEPGRRFGVEVLNKSAIVLVTACWEAYIEDLAEEAFDFLLDASLDHSGIPTKVQGLVGRSLKEEPDDKSVWKMADEGWRTVLQNYKANVLKRYTGTLNTPRPDKIDKIFEELIGLQNLSSRWAWRHMSSGEAVNRLTKYIELRGAIAHRVSVRTAVRKSDAVEYASFVLRLAAKTTNTVGKYLTDITGQESWRSYSFPRGS